MYRKVQITFHRTIYFLKGTEFILINVLCTFVRVFDICGSLHIISSSTFHLTINQKVYLLTCMVMMMRPTKVSILHNFICLLLEQQKESKMFAEILYTLHTIQHIIIIFSYISIIYIYVITCINNMR